MSRIDNLVLRVCILDDAVPIFIIGGILIALGVEKCYINYKFMTTKERLQSWLDSPVIDSITKQELLALQKQKATAELNDRFYQDLFFGTGGLRAVMGAGTNRLNRYTVGKATQGLSNYLHQIYHSRALKRGVAVAYDTRHHSREFAEVVADVLTANGIKVYLFAEPVPTPELSFAVQHLHALAGVVITASHNPKEYNGYKVYDAHGGQLVPSQAQQLADHITAVADYSAINFASKKHLQKNITLTRIFAKQILRQSLNRDRRAKQALRVVYTPLHGTGRIPVSYVLERDGFRPIVEPSQAIPDGDFPTVVSPNPEEKTALTQAIKLAAGCDGDLVLGTDPDCDRVGIAVKHHGEFVLLSGNAVGALLVDYLCARRNLAKMKNPAVIKTIVTSELGANIARAHGATVFSTLTGFKYIGEKITQFEQLKRQKQPTYTFLMGYEESYGYLIGTHARDKDAVVAAMLICELAAADKAKGLTLIDHLQQIYATYGCYADHLASYTLPGQNGQEKITAIMNKLRQQPHFGDATDCVDYTGEVAAEAGFGCLPKANVLRYQYGQDTWLAVRPSGTEPKIKFYFSVRAENEKNAQTKLLALRKAVQTLMTEEGK